MSYYLVYGSERYVPPVSPGPSGKNVAILGITYPSGVSPTISDNASNNWPATPTKVVDNGAGNTATAVYVLPNPNAATVITVGLGSVQLPFEYTYSEFSSIAPSSPVDATSGTAGAGSVSGGNTTVNTGSMTTNANGDLIWNYYCLSSGNASGSPTSFASGGSFSLLDADIAWVGRPGLPHASQYFIQGSSGTINPSVTVNGDTADTFNAVAVALKASGGTPSLVQHVASTSNIPGIAAGGGKNFKIPLPNPMGSTPSGMWVYKVIHFTCDLPPTGSWKLQVPGVGNMFAMMNGQSSSQIDITSVTDSDSQSWTITQGINGDSSVPQCLWRGNMTPNANRTVTMSISGTPSTTSWRCYDIGGANSSPFDLASGVTVTSEGPTFSMGSISPTAGGIVIAGLNMGQGPGLSVTSPAGAVWDLCTYPPDEVDGDQMENADGGAHLVHAAAGTFNFSWTQTNTTSTSITLVAFKSA